MVYGTAQDNTRRNRQNTTNGITQSKEVMEHMTKHLECILMANTLNMTETQKLI